MFSDELYKKENTMSQLKESMDRLSTQIKEKYDLTFQFNNKIIEIQLDIISLNFIVFNYCGNQHIDLISSICFKNIMTLISSLKLIEEGFFGSAKILFRNVYENLIIGKYIGLSSDYTLYEKWYSGNQISLKKDIFSKLEKSPSNDILEFWDLLNKYNHATVYSAELELELNATEFTNCISILETLLIMNYHLLNIFVSKHNNYYLNLYFFNYYQECKKNISKLICFDKKNIDFRLKKIINEYISKWILKKEL